MTELATVDQTPGTIERAPEQQPSTVEQTELMRWANDARQASQVARSLAMTSFVPASLRVEARVTPRMSELEIANAQADAQAATANNITGAILTGAELGLQPMAALRSIDIIQGSPALRAHAMRGLVQSAGHQIELVESTPELCRMRGRRRTSGALIGGYGDWQEVAWPIQRASQLGLLGKDQWKKQPQTMLVARATGELCRLIAADVLYAVPYAAEELDGDRPAPVQVASSAPVTAAEIMGTQRPAPAPAEDRPAEPAPAATTPPSRDRRTAEAHMFAILGGLGITDSKPGGRDDRLAVYSALKSKPIGSTKDLDAADLESIVAALEPIKAMPSEDRLAEVGGLITDGRALRAGGAR